MADFERDIPQRDEQQIRSTNFGGLNTTASLLNIPYEDSPMLLNAIADVSGNVVKRPGTRVLYLDNNRTSQSVTVIPFATGLQYNYLVVKQSKDIQVFEVVDDQARLILTKPNVWNDAAAAVRASYAATSEVEPRLIMCTGTNKPVQLRFVEQQFTQTSTGTTVSIPQASRFKNASSSNCVVFVNRVRVTGVTFSYNTSTTTLTMSGLPATAVGDIIDVCLITWQWWAEGMLWKGDRLFGSATRFNAVATDQNVKVPEKLLSDIGTGFYENEYFGMLTTYRKSQSSTGAAYTFAGKQPSLVSDWGYGDGTRYVYSTDNYLNPSPFFLTFGAIQSPTDPTGVYICRRRELKANNNTGVLVGNLHVYVDNVIRTCIKVTGSTNDVYKNYRLLGIGLGAPASQDGDIAHYISFEGTYLGVPANSYVEWANKAQTHIGTSAIDSRFDYNDGSYVIMYGLGTVADYLNGYFPSTVNLYQGRLVLSGFTHRPLTVLFSNVGDSVKPGSFYSSFQITDDSALATDAFDVVINSRPDDRIVAIIEWQSSLFALTRKAAFRLGGLNGQPLSPTSRAVNFISAIGCLNEACVVQTESNVVYLSDNGLYDLTPQVENGEYQVRERSIKIRDKFGITTDPRYESLPWVSYDAENRLVMVGYAAAGEFYTTRYLYVYNVFRDSWTEYNTPCGFNITSACRYVDRAIGNGFLAAAVTERGANNVPNNFILLKFNDKRFIDYRQVVTNLDTTKSFYITPLPKVKHTIQGGQRRYAINYALTQQQKAFTPIPVTDVNDLRVGVTTNGVYKLLQHNSDYVKEQNQQIYLLRDFPDGSQLTIELYSPSTELGNGTEYQKAVVVYSNNLLSKSYSVIEQSPFSNIMFDVDQANSTVEWGNVYLTIYSTPLFNLTTLAQYKRTHHIYAYFDNRQGVTTYTYAARNTVSGQDPQQIVDKYVNRINVNLTMLYNSDLSGETSADIYGYNEVYWDDSVFDIGAPVNQAQPFQLFKEPISGVGWSYQFMCWNYDDATFKLAGYMIDAKPKGKRYTGRY